MTVKKVFLRTGFNYDTDQVSTETGLACPAEESITQQHQRDDADINKIMARYDKTGEIPVGLRAPQFGDFTGVSSFQEALNLLTQANDTFMALPANIRSRFQNDPAAFVDFCSDEKNQEELEKLGLAIPKAKAPEKPEAATAATAEPAKPVKPAKPALEGAV